jgi:hypothetical protein
VCSSDLFYVDGSRESPGHDKYSSTLDAERQALSPDLALVAGLEKLYANFELLQSSLDALLSKSRTAGNTYVGIFDAPEKLTVIGRPRDPLVGEKYAKKLAIGMLIALMIATAGLVLLSEFFEQRLYLREEFESATGLQVIARLPRVGGDASIAASSKPT